MNMKLVNEGKGQVLKFKWSELMEAIFDISEEDLDKVSMNANDVSITNVYTCDKDDIKKVNGILLEEKGIELDFDKLEEVTNKALEAAYCEAYATEYYEAYIDNLETTLTNSFKNLPNFFEEELSEAGITQSEITIEANYKDDFIKISGDIKLLDKIIECAVVGYQGEEILDEYQSVDIEERIKSHIQYLSEIENIYGTVFDFFNYKRGVEYMNRYGSYGDTTLTKEVVIEAYNDSLEHFNIA